MASRTRDIEADTLADADAQADFAGEDVVAAGVARWLFRPEFVMKYGVYSQREEHGAYTPVAAYVYAPWRV